MLRVVLCIICLHPFLWVFLLALLYHTVKDFFVLILLKTCEFCMVLDVLQDFVAALGAKKAATGRSFLQFIILDDGGAGGEVGFFFVKKSEFLLAFCVVSVFLIEKGFTNLGIVFVSLGEKQVGDALLKEVLQKIVGFDGGAGGVFFVVAKDEVVAVEEGFEICQQDEAVFDLGEIVAFSGE